MRILTCEYSEEEAAEALTSDNSVKSKVRSMVNGTHRIEQVRKIRNPNERPAFVHRPAYKAPSGGVFIGAFRGKLGQGSGSYKTKVQTIQKPQEITVEEVQVEPVEIPQWSTKSGGKRKSRSARGSMDSSILSKDLSDVDQDEIQSKKETEQAPIAVKDDKEEKTSGTKVLKSPCENSKIDDIMVQDVKSNVKDDAVNAKGEEQEETVPVKVDTPSKQTKQEEEATSQTQTAETVDITEGADVSSKPGKTLGKKLKSKANEAKANEAADQRHTEALNKLRTTGRVKLGKKPRLGRVRQKSSKRAELVEVGTVRFEKGWHNNGYIFPDGYFAKTPFRSSVQLDAICIHECRIIGKGGKFWPAPTFEIIAQDRLEEPLVAKSPTGCWNGILKRINAEIDYLRKQGEE